MKICVNPLCQNPQNPDTVKFCLSCGSGLLLSNRFRPIEMIGQGGFGRTFKAVDEHSVYESKCLIKQFYLQNTAGIPNSKINLQSNTIIPGQQAINQIPDIYRTEVTQLAQLKHPQIPSLITHFEQDGYAYIVQEFIDGVNLEVDVNRQGAFTESQIWQVLNELLPVLKFIHDKNVIHRDIKPENIIRPVGKKPLVLVDFGAAKLVVPRPTVTTTNRGTAQMGTGIGTPNYMAPEQQKGREVFASDLYGLGVTCIRLLTNTYPPQLFDDGSNSWEWRSRCKNISDSLAKILDNLVELGTKKRYSSADEVIQDIAALSQKRGAAKKSVGNSNRPSSKNTIQKLTIWEKITSLGTGAQGLAALVALGIALGLIKAFTPSTATDALDKVSISSKQGIDYSKLRDYLRQKNWQLSDTETYEVLLKLGGEKSQSRGYINYDEIKRLSCTDLKTIDNLWRAASDGKFGFSAQQLIYENQGKNWRKMYEEVRWGSLIDGNFRKIVEQDFDWQTRRIRYKAGMEPDFKNPEPGHLPVTVGLVRRVEFPQFAEICKF
ncbi:MAG: GUN4 domain-containing protein [Iphinoe sp. HA4291-MV1]|jgi:serine/threonine protein kinase|nr:GUN4 domain-containing protein [Iphinoe sp. HA4291-MV1]